MSDKPTGVKVELHFTRNLGNFENIKIGIAIEDFVRDGENTSQATDRVYEFVENKLMEKVLEIEEELNAQKNKK
jgi:hypothetical protein